MDALRQWLDYYTNLTDNVIYDMHDLAKEYNKCGPTSTNANAAAAAANADADDGDDDDDDAAAAIEPQKSAAPLNLHPFDVGLGLKGGSSNKCIPKRIKSKAQQRRISLRRNCTRRRSRRRRSRSRHTRNLRR